MPHDIETQSRPRTGLYPRCLTALEAADWIISRFRDFQDESSDSYRVSPKYVSRVFDLPVSPMCPIERRLYSWDKVRIELAADLQVYADALPAEMESE